MSKNRSWKSLLFKVSHLDLEYQDRKDLMDQNRIEFDQLVCKAVGADFYAKKYGNPEDKELAKTEDSELQADLHEDHVDEKNIDSEDSDDLLESESDGMEKIPDSINKLWKSIAIKTHPDKNNGNDDYTSLYIEASNAYKEKSFGKLLIIGLDLGIQIKEDNELIPYIKDNINSLQEKINHIETLALWQWINAESEEQKKLIVALTTEAVKRKHIIS